MQFYVFWHHKQIRWFVICVFYVNVCIETSAFQSAFRQIDAYVVLGYLYCPVLEYNLNG